MKHSPRKSTRRRNQHHKPVKEQYDSYFNYLKALIAYQMSIKQKYRALLPTIYEGKDEENENQDYFSTKTYYDHYG